MRALVLIPALILAACGVEASAPAEVRVSCEMPYFADVNSDAEPPERTDLALVGCVRPGEVRDLEPTTQGLQPDCVATELDGTAIPWCDDATTLPCVHLRNPVEWEAGLGCVQMAIVEREDWTGGDALLRCSCE